MGADAPTTLKTDAALKFGGTVVPKGDYALTATRTGEGQWTLNVEKRDPAKPSAPGTRHMSAAAAPHRGPANPMRVAIVAGIVLIGVNVPRRTSRTANRPSPPSE